MSIRHLDRRNGDVDLFAGRIRAGKFNPLSCINFIPLALTGREARSCQIGRLGKDRP